MRFLAAILAALAQAEVVTTGLVSLPTAINESDDDPIEITFDNSDGDENGSWSILLYAAEDDHEEEGYYIKIETSGMTSGYSGDFSDSSS